MADKLPDPRTASSPWVGWSGVAAHPDAPLGGGGPGGFSSAASLGFEGNNADPIAHPQSPVARYRTLTGEDIQKLRDQGVLIAEGLEPAEAGPTANAPPVTQPTTFRITRVVAGKEDIEVLVEVLADGKDLRGGRDWNAATSLDPKGLHPSYPTWEISDADADKPKSQQRILRLVGVYSITGSVTIQIKYGALAKPDSPAAYGRGTTSQDKQKGDTTVGFHESCHVSDYTSWLKSRALPSFAGRVGMTVTQYENACTACDAAIEKYFADAEAASKTNTDEVGNPTLSAYKVAHPGHEH